MSLTPWIHSILCNMGLSSNISSNLYHFLSYSLSYGLHRKTNICVNKYLMMILIIKVITQKTSYISYKLIYLLRKKVIIVYKTYPQKKVGKDEKPIHDLTMSIQV